MCRLRTLLCFRRRFPVAPPAICSTRKDQINADTGRSFPASYVTLEVKLFLRVAFVLRCGRFDLIEQHPLFHPTTPLPLTSSRADQIFPMPAPKQIRRIATHGVTRRVRTEDMLLDPGDKPSPVFVVLSGEPEAVRPPGSTENTHHDCSGWSVYG